jgi:hypothetical protein
MSTPVDELRDQLTQAATLAVEDDTRNCIDTALELVEGLPQPELVECPVCERMGLPERIVNHDCQTGSTD